MKILVIAEKFPNRIQPWFANFAAQIVANGGELIIVSLLKGDKRYASVVDDFKLLERTMVIKVYGINLLFTAIFNLLNPLTFFTTYKGLFRYKSDENICPSWLKRSLYRLALAPLCGMNDIDVIHSHFELAGYRFLPLVKSLRVPFVITFHGLTPTGVPGLNSRMRKVYVDAADIILVNTNFAKEQYVSLGADSRKFKVLPQGTDLDKFIFKRDRLLADACCISVLSVGRLSRDKGHEHTIEAIKLLCDRGLNVKLKIIGQGPDLNFFIQLIDECGVNSKVEIVTDISESELISAYHNADIFVLSSIVSPSGWAETQGVVLQEAQATGALVVATRVGGIPECIDDGENGFLVNERDSEEIAMKIKWLAENKQKWPAFRERARMHVEKKYDINLVGKRMFTLYKHLISNDKVGKDVCS